MAQLFANNAASTLAAGITNFATGMTVAAGDGAKFPAITGADYFLVTLFQYSGANEINHEIVKVTARTTDALTITRAQEGTSARAFNAGDKVELRLTSGSLANIGGSTQQVTYANRATLRALTPASGDLKLVESLGLFRWYSASTEPDDDETCFVTSAGAWLLECPHWDVADAMAGVDESAQDDRAEDAETRLKSAETRWPGRWMFGTALCSITSITTLAQVSFTGTITGAAVNDYTIATPPDALDPRISVFARVTAADTITVYLNNPSASTATLVSGSWELAILKEI